MMLILNKILQYPKILSFIAGGVSVLALPPHYFLPVLFLTLGGLLLLVKTAKKPMDAFKIGYAFGFGFYSFGLSWIGNALLIEVQTFGWLYPIVFLVCGAFFGLFIALPCLFSHACKNIYLVYISLCSWWVIFEWVRSFIFTGFPWNLLGSVLAFSDELIQAASLGGTYFLSFICLIVFMAPALAAYFRTKKSIVISASIVLLSVALLYYFGFFRLQTKDNAESSVVVRLVQPNIPQSMKWDRDSLESNFHEYIKLSQSEGLEDVDFVIWGETATPFVLNLDDFHRQQIRDAIPTNGYLITGLVRYEFDDNNNYQPLNSMFVLNKSGSIVDYYDKSHLVPFGEYIPLKKYLPEWVQPMTNVIGNFKSGSGAKKIEFPNLPSLGGLICYEVIFPGQIIDKNNRPDWVANLTNDGWYGVSSGPYQHLVATRLRAVEEGMTIARSANTGISAIISPYGEIISSISLNEKGYIDTNLSRQTQFITIYALFGNFPIIILCFFNVLFVFVFRSKSKK